MDSGKQREGFASRLGFILVSAGCAVGIGNVWRFPTVTGQNGGGVFVLFYLLFLVLMGVPVLTMELAVGRAGFMPTLPRTRVAAGMRRAGRRRSKTGVTAGHFPSFS